MNAAGLLAITIPILGVPLLVIFGKAGARILAGVIEMKEFMPFLGVGFAAGFAIGVLINIWAFSSIP